MSYRLGVDVGGTFTDLVLVTPDGRALTRKVLSATDDYATAIVAGTLNLTLGGFTTNLTALNFSAAVDMAGVATILQTLSVTTSLTSIPLQPAISLHPATALPVQLHTRPLPARTRQREATSP
jgi:hypothetical protein